MDVAGDALPVGFLVGLAEGFAVCFVELHRDPADQDIAGEHHKHTDDAYGRFVADEADAAGNEQKNNAAYQVGFEPGQGETTMLMR